MSLLRLLTTGKSLVTITDEESRYRVTSQRLLPHFGAGRNPFSSSAMSEPEQPVLHSQEAQSPEAAPERCGPAPEGRRAVLPQKSSEARTARAMIKIRSLGGMLWSRVAVVLSGGKQKLFGLFARRSGKAPTSAIPRFSKPAVQGELSLDRIKVLRNDLSDADLEVVPAKQAAAPSAMRVGGKPAESERALERATTKAFSGGKT